MAKMTAKEVLTWFSEQPKDAAQVVIELAADELENRQPEAKTERRKRGPNKPKSAGELAGKDGSSDAA